MTNSTHELASFFVEASEALKELPNVRSRLAETEESLAICRDITHGKDEQIARQTDEVSKLREQILHLQQERDNAMLQEMEAKDQAQRLIDSIRDIMKGAVAADAILNPTPPQPLTTSDAGAELVSGQGLPQAQSSEESGSAPQSGYSANAVGEDKAGRMPSPLTDGSGATEPLDWDKPHSDVQTALDPLSHTTATIIPQPYRGMNYWSKPDNISWKDWVAGGGEKAPYVTDADVETNHIY